MDLKWNEFRAAHKGLKMNEMRALWKDYKAGTYTEDDFPKAEVEAIAEVEAETAQEEVQESGEVKRDEKEQAFLNNIGRKESFGPRYSRLH